MCWRLEGGKKPTGKRSRKIVAHHTRETDNRVRASSDQADFIWADTTWVHERSDLKLTDNQRLNHFHNHFEVRIELFVCVVFPNGI
jgi:hypothetical protein